MNKLAFDIFEEACEPLRLEYDGSLIAEFSIYPPKDGYILFSDTSFRVDGGKCSADLRAIPDGEYNPKLYTEDTMYSLPALTKKGKLIRFAEPDEGFIYSLAARSRFAARRIYELENKIAEINRRIDGAKLSLGDTEY